MSNNPLLEKSPHQYGAPAFDVIEEEHYLPAVKEAIKEARQNIKSIKENTDPASFENTVVALELSSEKLSTITGIFYNQLSAAGTDTLEALAQEIGPINAAFGNEVAQDSKLFERIKSVYNKRDKLTLTTEEKILLEDTYKGFVRGGALLNEKDKKRFKKISEELSKLHPAFANNVKKSSETFEMIIDNTDDLKGLPDNVIEMAQHMAEEKGHKGKWLFTLDYPSYVPFMTYADNRDLRQKIWNAFGNRAYEDQYDNCENIKNIVRLRDEKAKILGYTNHAEYILSERMAKTPQNVFDFLEKLRSSYKPAAEKELKELTDFSTKNGLADDIKPWDIAYYSEKQKQDLFGFSSEEFRPYFPLQETLDGVFDHFTKLLDLKFVPIKGIPTWHEDVQTFEVINQKNGESSGLLYADFFPRNGKKPGAWKTSYRDQGLTTDGMKKPIISIVCNFTKPTKDSPSLLSFDEVTTLLHEMGHAVHALCSDVTYSSQAGTNVLWDFVELPSQLQENWAYKEETLHNFARHYKTGQKIPKQLITKLNKSKNFGVGIFGLRQVGLGMLDMLWHTTDPDNIDDIANFEEEATRTTRLFPPMGGPASSAFSHIFAGGYSAGYYSYKWAEVLDADAFEAFEENGLYDLQTAESYKEQILSKGGSEKPEILYRKFRGRDADPDSLLRREGLLKQKTKKAI